MNKKINKVKVGGEYAMMKYWEESIK